MSFEMQKIGFQYLEKKKKMTHNKTNLDVSSFINGYYILNLKTEKENIQTKLQILK